MAIMGFILINTLTGKEHDVQDALSKTSGLSECYALHEDYDFLVVIHALDSSALEKFVDGNIHIIPGIVGIKSIVGISSTPVEFYRLSQKP